ncbi:hypothetical protein KEM60_01046 [Austwickia sp. TVS 96-490-7B]|nr:hypothetical protein [Austwickia sp. TVS 96-490-7B]
MNDTMTNLCQSMERFLCWWRGIFRRLNLSWTGVFCATMPSVIRDEPQEKAVMLVIVA